MFETFADLAISVTNSSRLLNMLFNADRHLDPDVATASRKASFVIIQLSLLGGANPSKPAKRSWPQVTGSTTIQDRPAVVRHLLR